MLEVSTKASKITKYMYFYIVGFCSQEFHTNNYKFAWHAFSRDCLVHGKALRIRKNNYKIKRSVVY